MSDGSDTNYETFWYGENTDAQFIRVYPSSNEKKITFAIIHGGYFKKKWGVDNAGVGSLVPFLTSRGYGVCLVEYRRVGHEGGGWPGTNEDVMKALATLGNVLEKPQKIVLLGHSAGGTLALYASCKERELGEGTPIVLCVAVAPIGDLEEGQRRSLSDDGNAIVLYMGCYHTADATCPYKLASPHHLLPIRTPCLIAVGDGDVDVPPDMVEIFYNQALQANNSANNSVNNSANNSSNNSSNNSVNSYKTNSNKDRNANIYNNNSDRNNTNNNDNINAAPPPGFLLIPETDHYNILNATEGSWLTLLERIEGILSAQI